MKKKQTKKTTVDALNLMICHVDKGPSGFWTDDYEGCGNPEIFPEFEEGLKRGKLVQKEHYLCPWNTAVMYGAGYGNICTGCYYSCSINKAKYLSEQELKEILTRFKTRLESGEYDDIEHLAPLLTEKENQHIEERIFAERIECEYYEERKKRERLRKSIDLITKYPNKKSLLATYYGEKNCVIEDSGIVFFNPDSRKDVVGAENMSYDEYIEVQLASLGHAYRSGFAKGIFNSLLSFRGQIEKINVKHICFKRIFISGMYSDGEMYDDKEEHVWMDKTGFEKFGVGDSVSFGARVYRYVKTGNGKRIDYGLCNPTGIQKIEAYELPSDDDLITQEVDSIVCENCFLSEWCNHNYCMLKQNRLLKWEMVHVINAGIEKEVQK